MIESNNIVKQSFTVGKLIAELGRKGEELPNGYIKEGLFNELLTYLQSEHSSIRLAVCNYMRRLEKNHGSSFYQILNESTCLLYVYESEGLVGLLPYLIKDVVFFPLFVAITRDNKAHVPSGSVLLEVYEGLKSELKSTPTDGASHYRKLRGLGIPFAAPIGAENRQKVHSFLSGQAAELRADFYDILGTDNDGNVVMQGYTLQLRSNGSYKIIERFKPNGYNTDE